MSEFFKPWRKRIAVVFLMAACLFTAGWVRSCYFSDKISIPISRSDTIEFSSMRAKFCVMRVSPPQGFEWKSSRIEEAADHMMNLLSAEWSLRICYLRLFSNLHAFPDKKIAGIVVPYWLPAIPLTLISLILLLTKPRKFDQSKIVEPTANEGA